MTVKNGLAAIAKEVVDDIQKEAEGIILNAEKEATEALRAANEQATKNYEAVMKQATTKAEGEKRKIASVTEMEMRNRLLQTKESLVDATFEKVLEELKKFVVTGEYHTYLLNLIEEVAKSMKQKTLVIKVNSNDKAWLTQDILNRLSKKIHCELNVSEETDNFIGGFKIQTEDGKVSSDSTIDNRLKELKPNLRVEIAKDVVWEGDIEMAAKGSLIRVAGPVVEAQGMAQSVMYELVEVGKDRLIGEIIRLESDHATIQVYQNTTGLKVGEPVIGTGSPLSVELAPGIVGGVFDGIQRPLEVLKELTGYFISTTQGVTPISRDKRWAFTPKAKVGDKLVGGDTLGTVQETDLVEHQIMVPPNAQGKLVSISPQGKYTITEVIAKLENDGVKTELTMLQKWPVRRPRPHSRRLSPSTPLITGQRVIDTFFPIAKGGSASIPGGFGTGKTVTQQQLAKWSDANIIIYVGCGERGNEMVDVLTSFPKLIDPTTGHPLMERTILVANTSNMPVSAREASIYTGITMAEYFRDMGYAVALMADSTSRWAEALREVSGRLEEMPAEEGFPSYLPSRLAEFYERTGVVEALGTEKRLGSICAIGAVSPPGGDFSEPVTQHTKRFTRVFWALDSELADARHYPAINWMQSYSGYIDDLAGWWHTNVDKEWNNYRAEAMRILQAEDDLKSIVKLVGPEALPDKQRLILESARIIRIAILQQNALDPIDTYSSPQKQFKMLKIVVDFHRLADRIVSKGIPVFKITQLPEMDEIMRMKMNVPNDKISMLDDLAIRIQDYFEKLEATLR